jgi:electron transfer flavoprotein alpha subunit
VNTRCALIVARAGALPAGALDAFVLGGRRAVVIGTGAADAAQHLPGPGSVTALEVDGPLPALAAVVADHEWLEGATTVVLPASPDGRDLAPVLAALMGRPLLTGATRLRDGGSEGHTEATVVRSDGLVDHLMTLTAAAVATVVPGLIGEPGSDPNQPISVAVESVVRTPMAGAVTSVAVLPPDPATMDLTEAGCIVAGGQGLASKERFDQLGRIGTVIGASLGGTRVASDAGWIPFERQIGTTGVAVNPKVYLAFAISGATQHTSGLGSPDHIISVNTDPACPMMSMSHVAIVSDANAVLEALERKLAKHVTAETSAISELGESA